MRTAKAFVATALISSLVPGCALMTEAPPPEVSTPDSESTPDGIVADAPPFALSTEQLFAWTPNGVTAEPLNISSVPLAPRFIDPASPLDPRVKVLYAPDGMNNLGNYLQAQKKFNLYNFVHWSRIDVLNWFAGAAAVNVPARPWVEAAHRNGVKVIGTVFFAPVVYNGDAAKVEEFLKQSPDGSFPAADKLIELAEYYGFDGWLMNQETDLLQERVGDSVERNADNAERASETARRMREFMIYLTARAPAGMEIHWYDSMLPDGRVIWQNELNERNLSFFQHGEKKSADAVFLNYWWNTERLATSVETAQAAGRSPYDVYVGADVWPARQNNQAAFKNRSWLGDLFYSDGREGQASIALFAPHFNFEMFSDHPELQFSSFRENPEDYESFYETEVRFFSGHDLNVLAKDRSADGAVDDWQGIGHYIPARSPLMSLPFATNFNTGHGLAVFEKGERAGGPWHDASQQDVQPQYLYGHSGDAEFEAEFDFEQAYQGGSALAFRAKRAGAGTAVFPLFVTQFGSSTETSLSSVYQIQGCGEAALSLSISNSETLKFELANSGNGWLERQWSIDVADGETIDLISLQIVSNGNNCEGEPPLLVRLGRLSVQ